MDRRLISWPRVRLLISVAEPTNCSNCFEFKRIMLDATCLGYPCWYVRVPVMPITINVDRRQQQKLCQMRSTFQQSQITNLPSFLAENSLQIDLSRASAIKPEWIIFLGQGAFPLLSHSLARLIDDRSSKWRCRYHRSGSGVERGCWFESFQRARQKALY